jgi:hypothetical protein
MRAGCDEKSGLSGRNASVRQIDKGFFPEDELISRASVVS